MNSLVRPILAPRWPAALLPFLVLVVALLAVYHQTAAAMVSIWMRSETYAHAFVVPPIVLWLAWRQRSALALLTPRPSPWALPLLAGAALVWLLSTLVSVNSMMQLAFTAMLVLAVPAALGWSVAGALAFPLIFLFFAVPVGEFLTPMMMQATADFTVMALRLSGIPVYREGLQFVIPSGNWSVVEACSGVRYLMASFMVGSLFAYLNYRSLKRRLVFVAVAIVMPVLANWVRAYMIVMLGHLSNNEIATGADHLIYGWVFFGVVIMAMFFIGARWSEPDPAAPTADSGRARRSPVAPRPELAWVVVFAAVLLVATPALLLRTWTTPVSSQAPDLQLPDAMSPDWVGSDRPLPEWQPSFADPSVQRRRTYVSRADSAAVVGVHIAYFRAQNDIRKLVSSSNVLVRGEDRGWNHLSSSTRSLPTATDVLHVRVSELLAAPSTARSARDRLQVWQMYWVAGRFTSSDVMAKILGAWQRISGQGDDAAIVLIYAAEAAPGAASVLLESFARTNFGALETVLRATRAAR